MARHNEVGKIGEDVAEKFLISKGLEIVERNYRKPYGELDIVAREKSGNGDCLHFVEVKTVSHGMTKVGGGVAHETHRPEENVHPQKLRRLARVIQTYLFSRGKDAERWQFDVVCVYLNTEIRRARVKWLKDIVVN